MNDFYEQFYSQSNTLPFLDDLADDISNVDVSEYLDDLGL